MNNWDWVSVIVAALNVIIMLFNLYVARKNLQQAKCNAENAKKNLYISRDLMAEMDRINVGLHR